MSMKKNEDGVASAELTADLKVMAYLLGFDDVDDEDDIVYSDGNEESED